MDIRLSTNELRNKWQKHNTGIAAGVIVEQKKIAANKN